MSKQQVKVDTNWSDEVAKHLLLHVDDLFHQRVNIFLVAEGILFAALAATLNCTQYTIVRVLICTAGVSVTLLLGYTLLRLYDGLDWLAQTYKALEKTGLYIAYRDVGRGGESANKLMAQHMPIATFVIWIILLYIVLQPYIS